MRLDIWAARARAAAVAASAVLAPSLGSVDGRQKRLYTLEAVGLAYYFSFTHNKLIKKDSISLRR